MILKTDDPVQFAGMIWRAQGAAKPYGLTVSGGNLRAEIRTGDRASFDGPAKERSELYLPMPIPFGSIFTAEFGLLIEPGPVTDRDWLIPFQVHADNRLPASPVCALNVMPSRDRKSEVLVIDANDGTAAKQSYRHLTSVPFTRGVVHPVKVLFVPDHGEGTGHLHVDFDGSRIVDHNGSTGFSDVLTPPLRPCYAKAGLYAGAARQAADTGLVAHILGLAVSLNA